MAFNMLSSAWNVPNDRPPSRHRSVSRTVVLAFWRMLPGVVAIDVPPDTPVAWVEAAADACEAALGAGRCMPATEGIAEGTGAQTTWRAVIVGPTLEAPTTLNIELYSEGEGIPQATRNLRFDEVDPERQRWASAGVVVAAMVSASEADRPQSLPEPEAAPMPLPARVPTDTRPPESPQRRGVQVWLDGAFAVSSGLEEGEPALGGQLAVGTSPMELPAVVVARFTIASKRVPFEARWLTGALGAGVRALDGRKLTVDIVPEIQLQHFRAQVSNPDPSLEPATDAGAELRVGGGLEVAIAWRLAEPVGIVLGGNASLFSPIINIKREDESVGRLSDFGWGGWAGARWIAVP